MEKELSTVYLEKRKSCAKYCISVEENEYDSSLLDVDHAICWLKPTYSRSDKEGNSTVIRLWWILTGKRGGGILP